MLLALVLRGTNLAAWLLTAAAREGLVAVVAVVVAVEVLKFSLEILGG